MREKFVDITVDEVGNITMDANGFKGRQCLNETAKLEEVLGKVTNRMNKPGMKERELFQRNKSMEMN